MNKKIKIVSIILAILFIIFCVFQSVYAYEIPTGKPVNNSDAEDFGGKIITVASVIGSFLSIIVLIVIGIKYMIGGTEEKASYKKSLLPYVIGCIIVFAASTLAGVIYNFAINF